MKLLLNASGDKFEVTKRDGEWRAEQVTGLGKNYLNLPATLHERSLRMLKAALSSHYSNS